MNIQFLHWPHTSLRMPKQISDDWPLGVIPYRALVNVVNVYDLGVYHFMRWKLLRSKKSGEWLIMSAHQS